MPDVSPNFGERRGGVSPSLIVLHYTGMQSCQAAFDRLCDPSAEVSAHYLISETGRGHALVPEPMRAWHAGQGAWAGIDDINSHSIGIELANPGDAPFAAPQMLALERLLAEIIVRWSIAAHRVIGHSDMAPLRKRDPGPRFDWRRLARARLSVWPDDAATTPAPGLATPAALTKQPCGLDIRRGWDMRRCWPRFARAFATVLWAMSTRRTSLSCVSWVILIRLTQGPQRPRWALCGGPGGRVGATQRGKSGLHETRVPGNARPG